MPADPLINIITRTSNRPLYFKECRRSIISQTYKNVKHIIGVDDVASESYLTSLPYTRIPSEKILDKDKIPYRKFWYNPPESQGESPAPWNLYMNHLYKEVEDGWVMFLDDDDNFVNEGSLKEICNQILNHKFQKKQVLLREHKLKQILLGIDNDKVFSSRFTRKLYIKKS